MNQSILSQIKKIASGTLPQGVKLILFGSQARGDNHRYSDWDLLLLVDDEIISKINEDDISYPFVKLGWDMNIDINPIIYTRTNWQKRYFTPFYKNVENDGVVLWA